jgi:hypothetical protein
MDRYGTNNELGYCRDSVDAAFQPGVGLALQTALLEPIEAWLSKKGMGWQIGLTILVTLYDAQSAFDTWGTKP